MASMKNFGIINLYKCLSFLLLFSSGTAVGQVLIEGPPSVESGRRGTYYYTEPEELTNFHWDIINGTKSQRDFEDDNYIEVIWGEPGTGELRLLKNNGNEETSITVQITCPSFEAPSTTLSASTVFCGSKTISYPEEDAPSGGISWYWQDEKYGESLANSSNEYEVYETGTYYLRPSKGENCWGTGIFLYVTVDPIPPTTAPGLNVTPDEFEDLLNEPGYSNEYCLMSAGGTSSSSSTSGSGGTTSSMPSAPLPSGPECDNTYILTRTYTDPSDGIVKTCTFEVTCSSDVPLALRTGPMETTTINVPPLCRAGSVTLTAPAGHDIYIWPGQNPSTNLTFTVDITEDNTVISLEVKDYECHGLQSSGYDFVINIDNTPAPIGSDELNFCAINNPKVSDLSATGTSIQWYNGQTEGSALGTNVSLTTRYYYATQTIGGCESDVRFPVSVIINDPSAPTGSAEQTFCAIDNPTVADLSASGSSIKWYGSSTSTTPLLLGVALSSKTYYATQTVSGCQSDTKFPVSVIINDPSAPTGSAVQTFCAIVNPTVNDLIASGTGTISWYGSLTGTTSIPSNTTLSSGFYYAGQTVDGCKSEGRLMVNVIIDDPAVPTGSAEQNFCTNDNPTLGDLNPSGSHIIWYDQAINGSVISKSTPLAHNTIYYAAQIQDGCESADRLPVTAIIETPVVPAVTITANKPTTLCSGESITLTANANTVNQSFVWSNGQTSNSITVTVSPTSDTEYFVTLNTTDPCLSSSTSESDPISIVVIELPEISIFTPEYSVCEGTEVTITATLSNVTDPAWEIVWSNNDIVLPGNGLSITTVISEESNISATLLVDQQCPDGLNTDGLTISIKETPIPDPRVIREEITETEFDIFWDPIDQVTQYLLSFMESTESDYTTEIHTDLNRFYADLTPNTKYLYKLQALDGECGPSEESPEKETYTLPPPVELKSIYANPLGAGSWDISWSWTDHNTDYIRGSEIELQLYGDEDNPIINQKIEREDGTSYAISGLDINKTYVLYIRQENPTGVSENSEPLYLSLGWQMNSIETLSYDELEEVIGHSKTFFDLSGRPLQSQVKNFTDGEVLATLPIYDKFQRAVGSTLPAPTGLGFISFRSGMLRNEDNGSYDVEDLESMRPLGAIPNTIGWYYSVENTLEPNTPVSEYPFSAMEFYDDGTGDVKRSAGPGNDLRIGSGHEVYSRSFGVTNELDNYISIRNRVLNITTGPADLKDEAIQTVSIDQNGVMAVAFYDRKENVLMSALQGNWMTVTKDFEHLEMPISTDFYIMSTQTIANLAECAFYELDDVVRGNTNLSSSVDLQPGFYKVKEVPALGADCEPANYRLDFGEIAYNFYDNVGRLVVSIAPNGVKEILDNGIDSYDINDLPYATYYKYNHQGWLLSTREPDAGESQFIYRKDGSIRYSQNSEQASKIDWSYTDYDKLGRPVESGEINVEVDDPSSTIDFEYVNPEINPTIDDLLATINGLAGYSATKQDWVKTYYDSPEGTIPNLPAQYNQEFVMGAVSATENEHIKTWYSYDEQGRVVWMAQKPELIDKTFLVEYIYDFLGNVLKVGYSAYDNEWASDQFYHYYTYDADKRLSSAYTSLNGNLDLYDPNDLGDASLQAKYEYYLHGPLKRIELGNRLQGIDFVYNINGWLKQINNPDNPDDATGNPDAFALLLNYYETNKANLFSPVAIGANIDANKFHGLPTEFQPSTIEIAEIMNMYKPFVPQIGNNSSIKDQSAEKVLEKHIEKKKTKKENGLG